MAQAYSKGEREREQEKEKISAKQVNTPPVYCTAHTGQRNCDLEGHKKHLHSTIPHQKIAKYVKTAVKIILNQKEVNKF